MNGVSIHNKLTWVLNKSATLINNNYLETILTQTYIEVISCPTSVIITHNSVFAMHYLGNNSKSMPPKVKLCDYSNFSESQFLNHLAQLNQESDKGYDINACFSAFYKKLDRVINAYAPLKKVSKRKA